LWGIWRGRACVDPKGLDGIDASWSGSWSVCTLWLDVMTLLSSLEMDDCESYRLRPIRARSSGGMMWLTTEDGRVAVPVME